MERNRAKLTILPKDNGQSLAHNWFRPTAYGHLYITTISTTYTLRKSAVFIPAKFSRAINGIGVSCNNSRVWLNFFVSGPSLKTPQILPCCCIFCNELSSQQRGMTCIVHAHTAHTHIIKMKSKFQVNTFTKHIGVAGIWLVLGVKNFLLKLITSRDGPVKSTETRQG